MRTLALLLAACSLALAAVLVPACSSPAAAPAPGLTPVAPVAPAASVSAAPLASAAPAACFPRALQDATIHSSTLDGDRLTVCLAHEEDQTHPCLALDLKTRAVERTAAARGEPTSSTRTQDHGLGGDERSFLACIGPGRPVRKRCDVIRPTGRVVSAGQGDGDRKRMFADISPDRSVYAAIVPERSGQGELTVDIATYSTRTLGPLGRRRVPSGDDATAVFRDPTDVWSLRWLDDRHVRLRARRCCGPDGSEALLDLRKGAFEALGDPVFLERVQGSVWLRGNSVRGADGPGELVLTFMHLDTGERTTVSLPGHPGSEPEGQDIVPHRWSPSWVVAHTNPPGVVWLDTERKAVVSKMEFALCP